MSNKTKEELLEEKKRLEAELDRQALEAEVKALEKKAKKPSLLVGVARVYVRGAKAALDAAGAAMSELNKPQTKSAKKKGKGK